MCFEPESTHRNIVCALLAHYAPDTEVWGDASGVTAIASQYSDLDLVVFAQKTQSQAVWDLREAFDERSLPYSIILFI